MEGLKTAGVSRHHKNMFDKRIDRRGTSCLKWDSERSITGREGLLPFWVADMDFRAPEAVISALQGRLDHGIFGYTQEPESAAAALKGWFSRRHGWIIDDGSTVEIPGIVPFLHMFIQRFTNRGDSVVIQEPVYYPFRLAIERNGRKAAENPLIRDAGGRWGMDLDNLRDTLKNTGAKMLILCSPHNPVGRVWTAAELEGLASVCREADVTVVSDEIHADLIQPGFRHIPWLTLPQGSLPRSMALTAPTKTFNLPGLSIAWAVIPDKDFRGEVQSMLESLGLGGGCTNPFCYTAAEAAWSNGDNWLEGLIACVGENNRLLQDRLGRDVPKVQTAELEGTYLAWLDLRRLELDDNAIWKRLLDAGIWLSRGDQFGRGGEGHLRMNLAAPRSLLEEGLDLMCRALSA